MTYVIFLFVVLYFFVVGLTFAGLEYYVSTQMQEETLGRSLDLLLFFISLVWPLSLPAITGISLVLMYISEYIEVEEENKE